MTFITLFLNAAILFSIFITVYSLPTASPGCVQYSCMKGWMQYGENCYKLERQKVSGDVASYKCSRYGGHLASIHSEEQQDFLNHFFQHENSNLWIGLVYSDENRTHVWEDGSEVDFTFWWKGEPSGYYINKENCVEMRPNEDRGIKGFWNDQECKSNRAFICQTKNHVAPTESVTSIAPKSSTRGSRQLDLEEYSEAALGSSNSPTGLDSERRKKLKEEEDERRQFIQKCAEVTETKLGEAEALGQYISTKLGKVTDPEQRMFAEALLTKVLNKAIMSKLTQHTHLTHFTSHTTSYSTLAPSSSAAYPKSSSRYKSVSFSPSDTPYF